MKISDLEGKALTEEYEIFPAAYGRKEFQVAHAHTHTCKKARL